MLKKTPFIINMAPTGVIPSKSMNPHVPISHNEIVDEVARCMELGVQMVHLHARDAEGNQSGDPELYGRLVETIRKLPDGDELIIGVTTTGRHDNSFESRSRVLHLDGAAKPDTGSLTLSSINFMNSASINQPDTIRKLAACMLDNNIKPELEVFDLGMANFVNVLHREGLLTPPFYVNVLLGNISGAQVELTQLAAILGLLPEGSIVSVAGLGQFQLKANTLGLLTTDGIRIGLEDNIWFDQSRTKLATNLLLIERILRLAKEFDRDLSTRTEVRNLLGMTRG